LRINYKQREKRPFYLLNERIPGFTFRIIDEAGKQIGILSRQDALKLAEEKELDLVLITNKANPPVVKLIDFKKFLYQENKKLKEARKGIRKSTVKDIKLSIFIAKNDLERLVKKAQEFIKEGYQVRIGLPLRGRELGKKPIAFDLINQFINLVGEVSITKPAKLEGRVIITIIGRKK
jgi:translation initiation factor IF-3